jgi:4-diphosphocytidyl-2-C-methyl-D-erythritol kinase
MAADDAATGPLTGPPEGDASLSDLARAKVNLFLHVRGRRPDGRHTLESLAVFPETGDLLTAERCPIRTLALDGPFAAELGAGADNLVIRAVEALAAATEQAAGVALTLDKRLPVASGIGGGSADAAATLRLLLRLWGRTPDAGTLGRIALSLGADVPVCLASAPALMGGIGERLEPAPAFPGFWMVLANPLRALSTTAVFGALERRDNPPGPAAPAGFARFDALVGWLARQRNDLEAPARRLMPEIGAVLAALGRAPGVRLARMSGSGATCFGLCADQDAALAAAAALRGDHPGWWIAPARVGAWNGAGEADGR